MSDVIGYLQHGKNPGHFRTEEVNIRHLHTDNWQAMYFGKWYKVNIQVNSGYIRYRGNRIKIQIDGVC